MAKIIFSDFDNTMLNYYSENNYFDDYKISVFKRLKEKGIRFCIVTGRGVSFFEQFPNLMEVIDYIAGSNGSCIYDVSNKKYIYHDQIDKDVLGTITKYLINNNYSFILNCKGIRYKYGDVVADGAMDYIECDDYSCEQIIVKSLYNDSKSLFNYLETINNIGINNIASWNNYITVDINSRSISKGSSVKWLCNYLDIDISDTMCFGDGDNDKSMFEVVDKAYAVGNAVNKLKTVSQDVIMNCSDNGIYKYIEDNFLK